jgi:serine/threonine protein kinase
MRWPEQIGHYKVHGLLGTGAASEVLLGSRPGADGRLEEVALKQVLRERADDPDATRALVEEGRLLEQLHHRGVIALREQLVGPPPVLVLERLRGATLARILEDGPLSATAALELIAQAGEALAAVHAAVDGEGRPLEIVHRDVSPENLFVTTEGELRLFDFNVAFSRERTQPPAPGAMQGRTAYMAPEQARGERTLASADVFSLAVVGWELLVGERLFWRGNTLATLRALVDEPVPALAPREALPAGIAQAIDAALARDPSARPGAGALVATLRAAMPTDGAAATELARRATAVPPPAAP